MRRRVPTHFHGHRGALGHLAGVGRMRHSLRARLVLLFLLFALAIAGVFLFGTSRMFKSGWQTWAHASHWWIR